MILLFRTIQAKVVYVVYAAECSTFCFNDAILYNRYRVGWISSPITSYAKVCAIAFTELTTLIFALVITGGERRRRHSLNVPVTL